MFFANGCHMDKSFPVNPICPVLHCFLEALFASLSREEDISIVTDIIIIIIMIIIMTFSSRASYGFFLQEK